MMAYKRVAIFADAALKLFVGNMINIASFSIEWWCAQSKRNPIRKQKKELNDEERLQIGRRGGGK